MRKTFLLLVLLVSFSLTYSQVPMGMRGGKGGAGQNMNIGHFYGKLLDGKSNKPIGAATIQLRGNKFDTTTKKLKEVILATVLSASNGDFSLENLPLFGNFKLQVSALGYKPVERQLSFGIKMPQGGLNGGGGNQPVTGGLQEGNGGGGNMGMMQQMIGMADKDLGNIKMTADATDLGNVTVSASSKPQFELGIDRKIFNVDKNLASTGQTATEVMKNIPSLNVDIDGNVTLRNATPTIFIDGRPTTLTLDQIPADIIERVEIITNPSAKYDASGGNAGILNIVLKKNRKTGYNGGVRTGVDSRGKINLGGDFNLREGKINFFVNGNYNQRKSIGSSITDQYNYTSTPSYIYSDANGTNNGNFRFFRSGLDYLIDNRNTLTVAGSYVRGHFDNETNTHTDSTINSVYTSYNQSDFYNQFTFENFGGQLSFKHNFEKNGHDISADFNYNASRNNSSTNTNTYTYYANTNNQKGYPLLQQAMNNGTNNFYTIQSDYENPISENQKLEMGVRAAIRDFSNTTNQYVFDPSTNKYVLINRISNNYRFNDQVYAAYVNYTLKAKKWSYQVGLRAESSNYTGTLMNLAGVDSSQFKVKYPISLFPSVFITYKIDNKQDLQVNYSRRVNRPSFFQLIPFPDYSNYPVSVNVGNPNLSPEFTNSFEFSYNNAYKKGSNFLATVYMKYTTNLLTRYAYRDKDALKPNTNDSVFYTTYLNANNAIAYGLELTNKLAVNSWWDFTANINIYNSQINATIPNQNIANSLVSWFGKLNNNFKITKTISFQAAGEWTSKTLLPQNTGGGGGGRGMFGAQQALAQGYTLPRYFDVDLAVRKDWNWKKGRTGSLTLSMNNIFATQTRTHTDAVDFVQDIARLRDPQVLRLNFSYRFGKFDASLFKRKNTKTDMGAGMDMMGGGS
ncbi:MAG: TonB-dependent receptor [Bacteroidota bacterium]|nr:TonB-dependent receptor [Bacteroidota bacterium]